MIRTKEQKEEFRKAFQEIVKPVIKFMNEQIYHIDPHCKIIIETNHAELLSGEIGFPCDEFVQD